MVLRVSELFFSLEDRVGVLVMSRPSMSHLQIDCGMNV